MVHPPHVMRTWFRAIPPPAPAGRPTSPSNSPPAIFRGSCQCVGSLVSYKVLSPAGSPVRAIYLGELTYSAAFRLNSRLTLYVT